jgi:putative hemolysin
LSEIARNPLFVDSETIIDDLFNELRSRRTHIAIVVDKSGNAVGLVTLEDIIEEILGEIEDETDILKKKVAPTKKLKHRVKSRVAVNVYS